MLNHLRETGADVVYSYYDEKKHSWFRNMGSWLTNAAATFLLGKPRDLYLSSFRAHNRELIDRIIQYRGPYPYIDGLILGATNRIDRKSTRLNSSHITISYAVFCLKKKKQKKN